ncbi:MAG: hypothetical protein IPK08_18495 [Bacteroidetes bacterium]|nr:hypothetical protein [Bacteroidota bacterium]
MKKIVFTLLLALVAFIADAQIQNLQKLGQLSFQPPVRVYGIMLMVQVMSMH